MVVQADCLIVVTYRDSNYLWKDRAVNQTAITETCGQSDRAYYALFCPPFLGSLRAAVAHRTRDGSQSKATLPTPLASRDESGHTISIVDDLRLHYEGQAMLTGVTWK